MTSDSRPEGALERTHVVVCEGPDDLAALRCVLRRAGATADGRQSIASGQLGYTFQGARLDIYSAGGKKTKLAARARELASGTASRRPESIAICFDPDDDAAPNENDFLVRDFRAFHASGLLDHELDTDAEGGFLLRLGTTSIAIRSAPWRSDSALEFAGLPDHHCLERVLITGILRSTVAAGATEWARSSTEALRQLVADHGWKRAFRVWSAYFAYDTDSIVDRLLQHHDTRDACTAELAATIAARVICSPRPEPATASDSERKT